MAWRIVYVTDVDELSLNMNSLKVKKGDFDLKIPLSDIFAVVIEDLTVRVSTRLLVELSNYNILVVICNQKHLPECYIQPISGHYGQYSQMQNQLSWKKDDKEKLWQKIVRQKILNQAKVMEIMMAEYHRIEKLYYLGMNVEINDPRNHEAQAARIYFNSFYEDFNRDDEEIIENAALNYGYTILHSAIARTIVAKGLIPALGIRHIGVRNHFNLASDFIEPFRPIVDLFVLKNPPGPFLTKEYRLHLINIMHARIYIDGKQQTLIRAIEIMIQSIIDYFSEGDINKLKLPNLERYQFYEL